MKQIKQEHLSSECWYVQLLGLEHCAKCEFKDTVECGGITIRKTGINEVGIEVTDSGIIE